MKIDKDYLAEIVASIVPDQARDVESLRRASVFAASHADEVVEDVRPIVERSSTAARVHVMADLVKDRLIELRNAWLRGHDAFVTDAERAAQYRAFYG